MKNPAPATQLTVFTRDHGFSLIGSYHLGANGSVCREAEVAITKRLPLVYAIFADEECRYVGKTIQGFSRPLNYHKNDVMVDVRDGILRDLKAGRTVNVLAKTDGLRVSHEGLELNLIEAIEHALIREHSPLWNNQVQALE